MKKSIGLTANTSDFSPNLPQTRHLNYFMGTNPVYMAGGGDVKAGIPNYPDVNVTRGFLPAALGFAPGGEADKDLVTKLYDFIFGYFKSVLGMDDEKAKEETDKVIKDKSPEEIQDIVSQLPIGESPSFDDPSTGKFEGMPPSTVTPKDTVTTTPTGPSFDDPSTGKFEGMPPGMVTATPVAPKTDKDIDIETGKFEGMPPGIEGGITTIPEDDKDDGGSNWNLIADLNGDGVVDEKDLEIARNTPGLGWIIKIIEGIIGGVEDLAPEKPEDKEKITPQPLPPSHPEFPDKKPKIEGILPDEKVEGLPPSHPEFPGKTTTPYDVAKERISKQPELGHWLQDKSKGKFDSVKPLGKDEQNLMKAGVGEDVK